jgi:hypothetical protein
VTITPESAAAHVALARLDAHEDVARRWVEARSNLLRAAFAEAYLSLTGVHPSRLGEYRTSLEALRDGHAGAGVTVEGLRREFQVNGESASGA